MSVVSIDGREGLTVDQRVAIRSAVEQFCADRDNMQKAISRCAESEQVLLEAFEGITERCAVKISYRTYLVTPCEGGSPQVELIDFIGF